ncbi:hypothetical protein [Dyadobacter psychrotolerans]|uniref:Transposase n=1 Tax=Dyadobacter psychrotolerans TaxID=2541721 RepID=A0A4R5DC54_9BACT|nr:hypothetical protein [Dyadobacter psychrotolerans]TDE09580.1 hypothetical protein E0F88_30290 [Dyadobacter psychrotolerans]
MDNRKKGKTWRSYESDFKQELVSMLISGKSASELSETFGIAQKRYAVAASLPLEKNGNYSS